MGRVYYDDGSYIDTLDDGSTIGYNTAGVAVSKVESDGDYFQSAGYWADARESNKLDAYTPAPAGSEKMEWWERLAMYGATRAIDANYGPAAVNKTGTGGTFAGQNGKTYSQQGMTGSTAAGGMGWLPLALAAAAAFFALS